MTDTEFADMTPAQQNEAITDSMGDIYDGLQDDGDQTASSQNDNQNDNQDDGAGGDDHGDQDDGGNGSEETLEASELWDDELKADFGKLDDDQKRTVLGFTKSTDAAFTEKTQAISEQGKELETMSGLLDAWDPYFVQLGAVGKQAQVAAIGSILQTEAVLRTGTEAQKLQAIESIHKEYGITPPKPTSSDDDDDDWENDSSQPNAEIAELKAQIERLEQGIQQGNQQQRQSTQQAEIKRVVDTFREEKDASGVLLHPHFDKLDKMIGAILQSGTVAKGDLKAAYAKAVLTDPDLIAEADKAAKLKEARDAAAKKASDGSNAKSSSPGSNAQEKVDNGKKWDSDEAMAKIYDSIA